jgi:hypothetical protein
LNYELALPFFLAAFLAFLAACLASNSFSSFSSCLFFSPSAPPAFNHSFSSASNLLAFSSGSSVIKSSHFNLQSANFFGKSRPILCEQHFPQKFFFCVQESQSYLLIKYKYINTIEFSTNLFNVIFIFETFEFLVKTFSVWLIDFAFFSQFHHTFDFVVRSLLLFFDWLTDSLLV